MNASLEIDLHDKNILVSSYKGAIETLKKEIEEFHTVADKGISCSCQISYTHNCKWTDMDKNIKKVKDDLTEVAADRDDLLRLIKDKDSELGEFSDKIKSLKSNNGKHSNTFADDYLRKIKEEKTKNAELTTKLDLQTKLIEKTEIALQSKNELVSAKNEIIANLKNINALRQNLEDNIKNNLASKDLINPDKENQDEDVEPKIQKNGVKECCEYIEVHATNGAITNALLLWADIQRKQHPEDIWKSEIAKKFTSLEITDAKDTLWRVSGEELLGKLVKRQGNSKVNSEVNDICAALKTLSERDAMPMFLCTSGMVAQTPIYETSQENNVEVKLNNINSSIKSVIEMIKPNDESSKLRAKDKSDQAGRTNLDIPLGGTISVGDIMSDATPGDSDWTKVTRRHKVEKFGKPNSAHLVVSGLNTSIKGLQIAQFLANKDIDIDDWSLLTTRQDATFLTFKIAVRSQDVDKIMEIKDWPEEGIQVRPYKQPNSRNKTNKNNAQKMRRDNSGSAWSNQRNNNREQLENRNGTIQSTPLRHDNSRLQSADGINGNLTGNMANYMNQTAGIRAPSYNDMMPYQPQNESHKFVTSTQYNPLESFIPSTPNIWNYDPVDTGKRSIPPPSSLYVPTATSPKKVRFLDRIGPNTFTDQY